MHVVSCKMKTNNVHMEAQSIVSGKNVDFVVRLHENGLPNKKSKKIFLALNNWVINVFTYINISFYYRCYCY